MHRLTDPELLRGVFALVAFVAIGVWIVWPSGRSDDGQGPGPEAFS